MASPFKQSYTQTLQRQKKIHSTSFEQMTKEKNDEDDNIRERRKNTEI